MILHNVFPLAGISSVVWYQVVVQSREGRLQGLQLLQTLVQEGIACSWREIDQQPTSWEFVSFVWKKEHIEKVQQEVEHLDKFEMGDWKGEIPHSMEFVTHAVVRGMERSMIQQGFLRLGTRFVQPAPPHRDVSLTCDMHCAVEGNILVVVAHTMSMYVASLEQRPLSQTFPVLVAPVALPGTFVPSFGPIAHGESVLVQWREVVPECKKVVQVELGYSGIAVRFPEAVVLHVLSPTPQRVRFALALRECHSSAWKYASPPIQPDPTPPSVEHVKRPLTPVAPQPAKKEKKLTQPPPPSSFDIFDTEISLDDWMQVYNETEKPHKAEDVLADELHKLEEVPLKSVAAYVPPSYIVPKEATPESMPSYVPAYIRAQSPISPAYVPYMRSPRKEPATEATEESSSDVDSLDSALIGAPPTPHVPLLPHLNHDRECWQKEVAWDEPTSVPWCTSTMDQVAHSVEHAAQLAQNSASYHVMQHLTMWRSLPSLSLPSSSVLPATSVWRTLALNLWIQHAVFGVHWMEEEDVASEYLVAYARRVRHNEWMPITNIGRCYEATPWVHRSLSPLDAFISPTESAEVLQCVSQALNTKTLCLPIVLLKQPALMVGYHNEGLRLQYTESLRHWGRMQLQPLSGRKNVIWFGVVPETVPHATSFFRELCDVYQMMQLGGHASGTLSCTNSGILRVPSPQEGEDEAMLYGKTLEQLGRCLVQEASSVVPRDNIVVVYVVIPSPQLSYALCQAASTLQHMWTTFGHSGWRTVDMVVSFVPWYLTLRTLPDPFLDRIRSLALMVYNQSRPRIYQQARGEPIRRLYAPWCALGSSVTTLHLAYASSPEGRWIACTATDEQAQFWEAWVFPREGWKSKLVHALEPFLCAQPRPWKQVVLTKVGQLEETTVNAWRALLDPLAWWPSLWALTSLQMRTDRIVIEQHETQWKHAKDAFVPVSSTTGLVCNEDGVAFAVKVGHASHHDVDSVQEIGTQLYRLSWCTVSPARPKRKYHLPVHVAAVNRLAATMMGVP